MMAWRFCRKDLAIYMRDRLGVMLGLGLPVVLALVFGAAMGGIGGNDSGISRVRFVVEDQDGSEASRALLEELKAADGLRLDIIEVPPPASGRAQERDALTGVQEGDYPGGLLILEGFGEGLAEGNIDGLVLYRDPGKLIEQQVIAGNLLRVFVVSLGSELGERLLTRALTLVDFPEAGLAQAEAILGSSWESMDALMALLESDGALPSERESLGAQNPAELGIREAESEPDDAGFDLNRTVADLFGLMVMDVVGEGKDAKAAQQAHAVSGIAVMMLLFGLVACGGSLLEEEAKGTLDRLRLAPCGVHQVLLGKFLFTWLIGMAQLTILFLVTQPIFSLPVFDAPLALVVLSAAVAAAATGFGVLFAGLCRTRAQLEGMSTVVILTMSAMGGSWWPLLMTPEWYQNLAHFTLNAWAMDGYQGLFWYGKDLAGILQPIGVLTGIAVVSSLLAMRLWTKRLSVT